jgi:RHS repeat-associated protein
VKKVASGVTTIYFYDPDGKLLEEYIPSTGAGKDYVWLPGSYEPLARVDFAMSDADNGNVLRVTKSSPNVHLDWSLDGTSGPFVLKRSLNFTFSNPVYLGPGQTTKTFDDGVLNNGTGYAYEAFRRTLTDTLYFYHADHLGTPIAMTNGAGTLVWRAEHTPFGGIYALTVGTITNNLRFPGQYYDGETGLAQNWWREYSSRLGRFNSADPLVNIFIATSRLYPVLLARLPSNLFCYSKDDPVVFSDFNGLSSRSSPGYPACVSSCVAEQIKGHLHRLKCCSLAAGAGGAGLGLAACALIVASEPELAPAFPNCALLAGSSTALLGLGACLFNTEVASAASVIGCMIGCGGF